MSETSRQNRRSRDNRVGEIARQILPSIGSLCGLIVLFLLVTNSWRFLQDSDTGWHIRTGEQILQTRSAPRQDLFSHTMSGREWFAWEWLSDLLMALAHRWNGLAGVVGGAIAILLASYAALYYVMIRRGSDPIIALAVTIFATLCSVVHWLARPHLVSIGLMVVWCALIESYRRDRSRLIYLAPLLIALWANLHGAFVSGLLVLAIYAIGEWLESALRREWWNERIRRMLGTYAMVGAASALSALATPYGYQLYSHIWRYLSDRELLATIEEFQSPNFHSTDGKLIELLLLFGVIAAVNALRRGRLVETGLLLLWGHLTLQSERHVTLASVVLAPIIAEQASLIGAELAERYSQGGERRARFIRAARGWYRDTMAINRQLTGTLVILIVLIFLVALPGSALADKWLSPRFNPKRFPVAAADYIALNRPAGNLYANDQFGGYLIYRLFPDFKVFIDGRSDFYRHGTVLDDFDKIVLVKPQWAETLNKYGIQWMVLRRSEPLALVASMSGDWQSVYEDSVALILVRKTSPQTQAVN